MLTARGIIKSYGDLQVLKGIDFNIQAGEIVSIVGASGAGKSTLLHILGTLDQADHGNVWIENMEIGRMKNNQLAKFRNSNIGFIFQFHNLLPEFTAFENICIPGFIGNHSKAKVEKRAKSLMKMLSIDSRADNKPSQLSGGEQQRAAVARALINKPKIVFADEPSGNLDSKNANDLHELFFSLRNELDQTFVIVTHNQQLAKMADRSLEMKDGIMLENGKQTINTPI